MEEQATTVKSKSIKLRWIIFWLIIFFPVGLILVWTKTPWSTRTKWIVTGVYFGLIILGGISSSNQNHSTATQANSQSTQSQQTAQSTPTPAITQQMKNNYISYYKQYMSIANQSDATNKKVLDDLTALSNNSNETSVASLYLEASNAEDTQNQLKDSAALLQVPDSLNNYQTDLNNAQTSLFTLTGDRSDTMKSLADFLNTNDLSQLKNIQNSTQDQQTQMEQAVVSLLTVGEKLGVDTTKINVGQ